MLKRIKQKFFIVKNNLYWYNASIEDKNCKELLIIWLLKLYLPLNPSKEENVCDYCGGELILRKDDNAETVKSRLEAYHSQTAPLIDFYTKMGVFTELDGTKDVSEVTKDMINSLS